MDVLSANEGFHVFDRAFGENDCTRPLHFMLLRKTIVKSDLYFGYVCPFVRLFVWPHGTARHTQDGFSCNFTFEFQPNFADIFRLWPKSDKNETLYLKTYLHFLQWKPTRCTISQLYFGVELYMFRTDLLSFIRSLNTVFTATDICHSSYVDCLLARSVPSWPR